jgi:ribose transport system substrate-binding protein
MTLKSIVRSVALAAATTGLMAAAHAELTIAYINKGDPSAGWQMINGGAQKAGATSGVKFIEIAPGNQDLAKQLAAIEDMISRKVDAIALAPIDSKGVAPAVRKAMAAGIPVVAVDTGVDGADVTSFVATDNLNAALGQGKWAGSQINDGDAVIYVTGDQSSSTGQERRKGFIDGLNSVRKNVTVIEVPTTWDQTQAQNGVETALRKNPKVKVIGCAWDAGALGAKAAMLSQGFKAGSIKIAGFDASAAGLDMMKQGWQQANAAQFLGRIGQVGVETAIKAAKGEKVAKRIDTGSEMVLPTTVDQFAKENGVAKFMREKVK